MLGQRGELQGCRNAQKQFIIKAQLPLILNKPVAQYPFTMACVQYVVMIHLSEQVRLIELETEEV